MLDSVEKQTSVLAKLAQQLSGFVVLIAVLVLLRGPKGTLDALVLQVTTLLGSFLGTGDGLATVVIHTLPLATSAAIATLLVARRILTFESFGSVVTVAVIIGAGALIGGRVALAALDVRVPARVS